MPRKVTIPKYLDPESTVVDIHINDIIFPNIIINLGDVLNFMTKKSMLKLNLQESLRKTTTMLQPTHISIVVP